MISQQLRRIAGLDREVTVEPLPGDAAGLGWRTRVRFAVGPDGTAGLRKHRSHEVIDVGHCPIAHPLVDQAGVTGRPWPGAGSVAGGVRARQRAAGRRGHTSHQGAGESARRRGPRGGPGRSARMGWPKVRTRCWRRGGTGG